MGGLNIILVVFCTLFFTQVQLVPLLKDDFNIECLKCHSVDENKINVHLIPHSHDDVGWLKTLDQYYYGLNSSIQNAAVQYIITSVVMSLQRNPDRRFIQVETAFFWKWWQDQAEDMRDQFRSLVENGQIEIVNGAWSMNDEACVNYQSTIDQFTWGLNLISETVGTCGTPRVGWQIDPFGHSREQASLFAQMGYGSMFFSRLDHDDKDNRQKTKTMDFAWQGSANLENTTIFGSNFATYLYGPPAGFCWDILCNDDPVNDDPESPDYNILQKVEEFTKVINEYKNYFPTNNIIIPMGEDFQYSAAEAYYINIDRFIKAFQNNSDLNLIYSTPSCYVKAVNDANTTLLLKTDDFFPYSNDEHSFWAGYFTSRPNSKRFERVGHNTLQVAKQIYSLASQNSTSDKYENNLRYLRETMGTLQHHDAVTGTEKQHVASDYVRRLSLGIKNAEESIGEAIKLILGVENSNLTLKLSSCLLANISVCSVSQNSDKILAVIYNPLAWATNHFVRLPVEAGSFRVSGPDGGMEYDVVPVLGNFSFVNVTEGKPALYELVFNVEDIPPLGFKTYVIEKISQNLPNYNTTNENTLGWLNANFTIDPETNLLKSIVLGSQILDVQQDFYYYQSVTRDDPKDPKVVSGAYLFRPNGTSPIPLSGNVKTLLKFDGEMVKELHQQWSNGAVDILQSIRVYRNQEYLEFDWIVGNIELGDNKTGKEIVTRYTFKDFDNNNTFYTDSNGREMIKRVLNYRPDYTYNSSVEPIGSNYYPVTSNIVIKDDKRNLQIAVLNDRSQGGSSLNPGEIEFMVHRRLFQDDNKGVAEPLNETEFGRGVYVRGTHTIVLQSLYLAKQRVLAQKKLLQPWIGLSAITDENGLDELSNVTFSALTEDLSPNVNLLTFEPWKNDSYLLRLEHIFEKDEDLYGSVTATVDLSKIFRNLDIIEFDETTLAANLLLEDYNKKEKYTWQTKGTPMEPVKGVPDASATNISLTPMQIRTFIVKLANRPINSGLTITATYTLIGAIIMLLTISG